VFRRFWCHRRIVFANLHCFCGRVLHSALEPSQEKGVLPHIFIPRKCLRRTTKNSPPAVHVIQEKLDESAEEDDESGPKSPTEYLRRTLKRIRNGEEIDDIRVFRTPPDSAIGQLVSTSGRRPNRSKLLSQSCAYNLFRRFEKQWLPALKATVLVTK
jgi:hypothetical protein